MVRLSSKRAKSGASPVGLWVAYYIGADAHNFHHCCPPACIMFVIEQVAYQFSISPAGFLAQRLLPSDSAGVSKGTSQISRAYSPMERSEENHAIWAMFCMHIRVQSDDDSQSLSTRRWVAT